MTFSDLKRRISVIIRSYGLTKNDPVERSVFVGGQPRPILRRRVFCVAQIFWTSYMRTQSTENRNQGTDHTVFYHESWKNDIFSFRAVTIALCSFSASVARVWRYINLIITIITITYNEF